MNYLYGWNPIAEFVLDEFEMLGIPIEGVVIDDAYIGSEVYPNHVRILAASNVFFGNHDCVVNCLGYKNLNKRIFVGESLLGLGVLRSFISQKSQVHGSAVIGVGTVLLGDVVIERRCDIGRHGLFWGGSRICHDSTIGNGVFLASGSIIGGECKVGHTCSLGFNSAIREKSYLPDGTKVGANRFWRPST